MFHSLAADLQILKERFSLTNVSLSYAPRFNIAPTQEVMVVTADEKGRYASAMRWGLIPMWAKDLSFGNRMINARAETLEDKATFRQSLPRRRCLVIADGFFEWKQTHSGKVPMRITKAAGEPFAFAGLWSTWKAPLGAVVYSCTIITTRANTELESIHDRMPAILCGKAEDLWIDTRESETSVLKKLLIPYPAYDLRSYEVSKLVNSPKNDSREVILAVT